MNNQDSQLIVQSLSNLGLSSDFFNGQEAQKMFRDMKSVMENAKNSADKARLAKQAVENGNWLGSWWHDRKDALRDAQHDLSLAVADLSENNSKLLIFNTAISKMLLDAQHKLNEQQIILNNQARELKSHTEELANQNEILKSANQTIIQEQAKLDSLVREFVQIKGLTREQVGQIAQIVKDANALKEELTQQFQQECAVMSKTLQEAESVLLYKYNHINDGLSALDDDFKEVKKSIDGVKSEIDDNKTKQESDILSVKSLLTYSVDILKDKNKELRGLLDDHKKSLTLDIDEVKNNLESANISMQENYDELSGQLSIQSKIMVKKEKDIHKSISDAKESLLEDIGVLSSYVDNKISEQNDIIKNDSIELKSLIDDNNQDNLNGISQLSENIDSTINEIKYKFLKESEDIKQSIDDDKIEFENQIFEIQEYFYYEINKLRKTFLILFILLMLVIFGLGFYILSK